MTYIDIELLSGLLGLSGLLDLEGYRPSRNCLIYIYIYRERDI